MSKFQIFYPGVYTEREKPYMAQFVEQIEALKARGPIDVKALINGTLPEGTPGVGPKYVAEEDMMLYNSDKYDPENPLYNDDEYAKSLGYKGKIAMPFYAAHDDSFLTAFPREARDIMCVCSLNHSITQLAPIYVGDTLYLIKDSISFRDITDPNGSEYRSLALTCQGTVYNQDGVAVTKVSFGATENLKSWAPGVEPDPSVAPWESPDWWRRPEHYYTDDDWALIKHIWSKEKRRGKEPLYWEDVNIGDIPTWTLEGPIERSSNPTPPFGMGVGGSRTMKKEIMDPDYLATMRRDEATGIYYPQDDSVMNPTVPEFDDPRKKMGPPPGGGGAPGGAPPAPVKRSIFINFMGRDFAVRHFNNWMGDSGFLINMSWGIMTDLSDFGYSFAPNPELPNFIVDAPAASVKELNAHGLQHDVMLFKSQVVEKFVRDGEHLVKLIWWVETIDGYVYEHGSALVKLPSKND